MPPDNGDLRIVISKVIIEKTVGPDLQGQLDKIAKKLKLNVNVNIDKNIIQSLNKFISAVEKMKSISEDQNKTVSETQDVFKKLDGTVTTLSQKVLKSGEVIQKTKNVHDENKKSVQKETEALNEQKKSLEELLAEHDRYNKLKNVQTRFDSEGKITGSTNTYSDGNSMLRATLDNEQNVIKYTIIDRVETEKLIQTKDELRKKLQELAQIGALSKQQLGNVARDVNTSFDDKSIKQAKESLSIAQQASQERISFLQQEYKLSKTQAEQMAKWVKDSDRAHFDAFKEKEKREIHLHRLVQDRVEAERLAYEQETKRSLASSRVPSGRFIGESIGVTPTVDKTNIRSMQEYVKSIGGLEAELTSMAPKVDKVHGNIQELHYRVKEGGKYWHNYIATLVDATGQTHLMDKGLSDLTNRQLGFSESMKIALTRITQWGLATSAIYGSLRQLKEGISYIYQLDNSLNEIRIVTGKSQVEVQQLAAEYSKLGKSISVSTIELAKQGADLFRQGLDDSQVKERMDAIVKYAKISSLSLEESNNIITASVNGTKAKASELIDVFSYLGDTTSTGADEIGRAFQKTASLAAIAGLDYRKLASYIATVSSVTRESAETVGNSFKSLLSRFQSIKEKGFNQEDATNINMVTKALKEVGDQTGTNINAIDKQTGQLRNYGDVLDDLSKVWDKLNPKQKEYLQTVLGGTYQADKFAALMNNYTDSIKNYTNSLNVAGVANQKFQVWQDSSAAKLEKFKSVWQGFWQNAISSDALKSVITVGTNLISVVDKINTTFGSFGLVAGIATVALVAFNNSVRASTIINFTKSLANAGLQFKSLAWFTNLYTSSTVGARIATIALQATMTLGLSVAIAAIVSGLTALVAHYQKVAQDQKEFEQQQQSIAKNWTEQKDKITELIGVYEDLSKLTKNGTVFSDSTQEEKYKDVIQQLSDLMPSLVQSIDDKGNKHLKNVEAIKQEITYAQQLADINNKQLVLDGPKTFEDQVNSLRDLQKELDGFKTKSKLGGQIFAAPFSDTGAFLKYTESELNQFQMQILGTENKVATASNAIRENIGSLVKTILSYNNVQINDNISQEIEKIASSLNVSGLSKEELADKANAIAAFFSNINNLKTTSSIQSALALENSIFILGKSLGFTDEQIKLYVSSLLNADKTQTDAQQSTFDLDKRLAELHKTMEDSTKELDSLQSAYRTLNQGQNLSLDTIIELISKHPELASALRTENGILTINKDAVSALATAKEVAFKSEVEQKKIELKNAQDTLTAKLQVYSGEIEALEKLDKARFLSNAKSIAEATFLDDKFNEYKKLSDQIKALDVIGNANIRGTIDAGQPDKKTKAEPKPKDALKDAQEDISLTKELVSSYNQLYDARQKNIASLDRKIKTAEKAKDEARIVDLINKKIKEQTASIDDLRNAQEKMHSLSDKTRTDAAKLAKEIGVNLDTEKWFDAAGNGTLAYGEVLQKLADKSQAIHDNTKLSVKDRNEELDKIAKQKKQVEDIFAVLQLTKQGWKANSDEIIKLTDEIGLAKESIQQIKFNVDKKSYENLRDAELKIVDSSITAEEKRHQNRMDNLDAEMNKFEDSVNLIKKSISRDNASEDFNASLSKAQKEAQDIQNKINQYSLDNSIEGQAKKVELEKEYAAKQEEIAKMQLDRTRQLRENSLDDLTEAKKKEVDANKKSEDTQYKNNKENLDKMKLDITSFWETTINDENTYLKTQAEVIDGHLSKVKESLQNFFKDTSTLSQGIGNGLLSGITGAANNVPKPSYGDKLFPPIGKGAYSPASIDEQKKIQEMYDNSIAYKNASATDKPGIMQANQYLGNSIQGAVYDSGRGIWTKNGMRLYHQGGEVGVNNSTTQSWLQKILASNEVPAILKKGEVVLDSPLKFLHDISSRMMQNLSNVSPRVSAAGGGDTTYNIDVNIDKLTGGKEGASQFFTEIQKGLRSRKFN